MDAQELEKLAHLARIDVSAEEFEELAEDFGSILKYISRIKEATVTSNEGSPHGSAFVPRESAILCNVMREDGKPHESGMYSEGLLAAVPQKEGGYVRVKKIL